MTYLAAFLVYEWLYGMLYVVPGALVTILAARWLHFLGVVLGIFSLLMFFLASYRAHLAAQAYGQDDIGFWKAHSISGQTLRVHLAFLPLVGRWFYKGE